MTRFAIRDAIYRVIWVVTGYNERDVANRKSPAIHRKSPMCLQYRDLRRDTRFATSLLEIKKSFIFAASRDLALQMALQIFIKRSHIVFETKSLEKLSLA